MFILANDVKGQWYINFNKRAFPKQKEMCFEKAEWHGGKVRHIRPSIICLQNGHFQLWTKPNVHLGER